ncbi:GNAT family N-acetyltransferase [uncultured Thomasclavelia sp.]|uniref:GNAT family N-acetyltransferase n=1 Tax=uncultured Thomasclavelia sp. TaxID=3025759 RepID=UPI0025D026D2|nr:GNAT family N-acetyltransferase [uncultured Thomasclavelia sp.]
MSEFNYQYNYGKKDFDAAKMIRQKVFVEEQGFSNEFDEIDDKAYHLVIYQDNLPLATGRMYPKDDQTMILGRIAVLKPYRKHHLGSKIVIGLEDKARELGYMKTELSAQQQAMSFYQKLGYISYGDVYYDEWCPHVSMSKQL